MDAAVLVAVAVPVVPPRPARPTVAVGRCAADPAPQQQDAHQSGNPQEPQAAARPADQPDPEKQDTDPEPGPPGRPPRRGEPAMTGLNRPGGPLPGHRRAVTGM